MQQPETGTHCALHFDVKRLVQTNVPEFEPDNPWLADVEPRAKRPRYVKCAVPFCRRAAVKGGLCKRHGDVDE